MKNETQLFSIKTVMAPFGDTVEESDFDFEDVKDQANKFIKASERHPRKKFENFVVTEDKKNKTVTVNYDISDIYPA